MTNKEKILLIDKILSIAMSYVGDEAPDWRSIIMAICAVIEMEEE